MKVAASAKERAQQQDCVPIELPAPANGYWCTLDFSREQQCQANWCWAAVASSVAHFYRPKTTVTQCSIANGELRRQDCCDAECNTGGPCDVYGFLMSSLFRVGHFRKLVLSKQATLKQICVEIDKDRPLCARLAWFRGGAHFVTIMGYAPDKRRADNGGLAIVDPWWGWSDIDYEDFPASYRDAGTWTDTYYTRGRRGT